MFEAPANVPRQQGPHHSCALTAQRRRADSSTAGRGALQPTTNRPRRAKLLVRHLACDVDTRTQHTYTAAAPHQSHRTYATQHMAAPRSSVCYECTALLMCTPSKSASIAICACVYPRNLQQQAATPATPRRVQLVFTLPGSGGCAHPHRQKL